MAPRIIKQGTARAAVVQPISFAENIDETELSNEQGYCTEPPIALLKAPTEVLVEPDPPSVDLANLEKTAYENGFRQGEKAGMEIAERKMEAVMKRYAEAIFEVSGLRSALYGQIEQQVVKLALAVSKKIVHREIRVDPEIIQTLVRVALGHVSEKANVVIHLNPIDYNYLIERRLELSQSEGRDISLMADESVERGGCLIHTDCGDIDARIEEKFQEVERTFFEGTK